MSKFLGLDLEKGYYDCFPSRHFKSYEPLYRSWPDFMMTAVVIQLHKDIPTIDNDFS